MSDYTNAQKQRMEEENYIEEFKGGASRKVLITQAQFDERFHG